MHCQLAGWRASDTTFAEPRPPFENPFDPLTIGSATNMTSTLPLQFATFSNYISNFGLLADNLDPDFVPERDTELDLFCPDEELILPYSLCENCSCKILLAQLKINASERFQSQRPNSVEIDHQSGTY